MITTPEPEESFDKYDELRLHWEWLNKQHLINFEFSMRLLLPLERAGIRTVGDITKLTREQLLKVKGLGVKGADVIEQRLNHFDIYLAK